MKTPAYWGIAGSPIAHSLTPRLFKIVGEYVGISGIQSVFIEAKSIDELRDLSFDDEFDINIEEYLPSDDLSQAPLPPTPGVDPTMIQPAVQQASLTQTGLTPSEQALLSPEEQAIRLRQRGMA